MFKGLGNIASMMNQAQQMGSKMNDISEQMRTQRVQGTAGGGMVTVEANGAGEILSLQIEPSLIERGEREMLEDLIPAAVNQALARAKELHAEAMKSVTSGLDLPGLDDALAKFTGGGPGM